jgi:hypothetical protein
MYILIYRTIRYNNLYNIFLVKTRAKINFEIDLNYKRYYCIIPYLSNLFDLLDILDLFDLLDLAA